MNNTHLVAQWLQRQIKDSSAVGLMLGFFCLYVSYVPMLLPRVWWLQAISGGINAIVGYAFGMLLGLIGYWLQRLLKNSNHQAAINHLNILPIMTMVLGFLGAIGFACYHYQITAKIAQQVQITPPSLLNVSGAMLLSLLLWGLVVFIARLIKQLVLMGVERGFPQFSTTTKMSMKAGAFLLLIVGLVTLSRDYIWHKVVEKVAYSAMQLDTSEPDTLSAPFSRYKSGFDSGQTGHSNKEKPAQQWQELGHFGQRFVSLGASQKDISLLTGLPAKEPIRVFVGLNRQEPDKALLEKMVQTALDEMDRTQAFTRRYIVIQGATGRGWIEEYSSQAVEYLTQGDVATVAIQYSYLPSQFSFLLNGELATFANSELINAVKQRLEQMPIDKRPKLLLAGESLGAYASQSLFNNYDDVINRIDGAVWVGTPRFSPLWQQLVANRNKGSTEALPIIHSGQHVRFMDNPASLKQLTNDWQSPRIVFLQYATDPIVWWSSKMLWQAPDWMAEPKGRGVSHLPRWLPVLSFWELSLDMPASNQTPAGFGHIYEDDIVYAWAAVLDNSQVDPKQVAERIEQRIAFTKENK